MIESMSYVFTAISGWISQFGSSAAVGYGYLSDFIFTVIIVVVLLMFIKRLV